MESVLRQRPPQSLAIRVAQVLPISGKIITKGDFYGCAGIKHSDFIRNLQGSIYIMSNKHNRTSLIGKFP
jgi:hypothetical protein